ncbi:MAG: hypothetical protein R3323_00955 [Wenzhouxiangellaceae bacterium]|nr:hypothetical protein [Wenzhouxiangellaceae bacterium]
MAWTRLPRGTLAGIAAGIVFAEGVLLAADAMLVSVDLDAAFGGSRGTSAAAGAALGVAWLIGGAMAGMLGTLVATLRLAGLLAGASLCLPAAVLAWFAVPGPALAVAPTLAPLAGAAAGCWLAGRLLLADGLYARGGSDTGEES